MATSLKDIANALGISISLVSKVLNNRMGTSGVNQELADSIRKKAKELHYRKNSAALSLLKGSLDTIGVFVHNQGELGSALPERFLKGVAKEARTDHKKLMVTFFEETSEFLELVDIAHNGLMDGLIISGVPHTELSEKILKITATGLPVVSVLDEPMHPEIPNIATDQEKICYISTRHLIEQGCKRIGHINSRVKRYSGYQRAMQESGLPIDPAWVLHANEDFSLQIGRTFAEEALKNNLRLDGFVGQSDQQAAGVLNVFTTAGIRCPEEIKVIGVDDAPFCIFQPTPISSVTQWPRHKGRAAVRALLALCDGEKVENLTLEPELRIRRSSGGE